MYFMTEAYPMQHQMNSKKRRRLNSEETKILQAVFERNPKPDAMLRAALADRLGMTARNIQIWFQNKRAKTKKVRKDSGSEDELTSPTTATNTDFGSVFTQEYSPTEDSVVKSKAILPKVYYPTESQLLYAQSKRIDYAKQPKPTMPQTPAGLKPTTKSFEQSLDMFNEVTCNDFDFLNFLEDC